MTKQASPSAPLSGLKVIELGQLIAGPFAGKTLGDFGATVIKIESPGSGDPLRNWRIMNGESSIWWEVQSRNKKSVVLDLKSEEGQETLRVLVQDADVLIENFRPGMMETWGLGYTELSKINPRLIMLRVSGFGQSGPYKNLPGFGVVGEAMGGLRYLTAEPGRVPVRVGVSIGDTLAALHGVIGILLALQERNQSGLGQEIDVALYESVFNCMESLIPEYGLTGKSREPAGSSLPGIAPSNAYPSQDGWVLVAGNGDSIFKRLMTLIGREDLANDPELADNQGRVKRVDEIDAAIAQWTQQRSSAEVVGQLNKASVPGGLIYAAADIAKDPHYAARDMLLKIKDHQGSEVLQPGIVPKLSRTPGSVRQSAPRLGEHTEEVLAAHGLKVKQKND